MNYPLVYVVIPNKNGSRHLKYSLKSLCKSTYPMLKIVMVDNFSDDDSVDFVNKNYPDITIMNNSGKKGFAGGVNTGIKFALSNGADYVAVFSNDIKVLKNWIELLISVFNKNKKTGLVGLTEISRVNEKLFYDCKLSVKQVSIEEKKGVAGCLYLCSSKLFNKIGLLDEDYYMYGEDNDWFYRINKAGFKILDTNIPVWHYGEGFSKNNKFLPTWYSYRNAIRFSIKNQSILLNIKMILSLLNQGCNVFLKKNHPSIKRLQRYNPLLNIFLIMASILWNLFNIVPTMKSRFTKSEF